MSTTLYRHFGHDGNLLYVGIANEPPARLRQHRKDKEWWVDVRNTTHQVFDTRKEAEAAEREAIKAEHPSWNIQHNSAVSTPIPPVAAPSKPTWAFKLKSFEFDHRELAEFSISSRYSHVSFALQKWAELKGRFVEAPEDYRPELEALAKDVWANPDRWAKTINNRSSRYSHEQGLEGARYALEAALHLFTDNDFSDAMVGSSFHPKHANIFAQTVLDMDEARWYRDWPWTRKDFVAEDKDYHDLASAPIAMDGQGLCLYTVREWGIKADAFKKYAERSPTKGFGRWTCWYNRSGFDQIPHLWPGIG